MHEKQWWFWHPSIDVIVLIKQDLLHLLMILMNLGFNKMIKNHNDLISNLWIYDDKIYFYESSLSEIWGNLLYFEWELTHV